jgi:hypothetical protein
MGMIPFDLTLAVLIVAMPPIPELKPMPVEVRSAPVWTLTPEHALCFEFTAENEVLRCLTTFDMLTEIKSSMERMEE